MKKYAKWIAAASLLCFGIVATGCGGDAKSDKKIVIEYWHINSENFGLTTVKENIARFEKENPNIKVEEKYYNGYMPLMQGVQAALASGKPPAVAQIGYNYLSYAADNIPHTTIDEIVAIHPEDKEFLKTNYSSNILELGQYNGKQQGMPYSISNPVLYYNPEIFKQAGLDPNRGPKTWDEVEAFAKQIKEKANVYGISIQEPPDSWAQEAMMFSNGAKVLVENGGKFSTDVNSPEAIESMSRYATMVKNQTALHTGYEEGFQAFVSGKVAMHIGSIARQSAIGKNAKFKAGAESFPTYGSKKRVVPAGGNNLFVFAKDTEQQKAAWKFIKFLQSPESLTAWTKGTGYLPPRKGVAEDPKGLAPMIKENVMMQAAVNQLAGVRPWLSFPGKNGLQIEQVLLDAREAMLSGKQSAQEAWTQAAEKINKLLQ